MSKIVENIKEKYNLTSEEMEEIYRYVSYQYTLEDVLKVMYVDYNIEEGDMDNKIYDIAEKVTECIVYDGEEDANLSYWDNIHNLIEEELRGGN